MTNSHYFRKIVLFGGDILLFYLAFFISLVLRYGEIPSFSKLGVYKMPITTLLLIWLLIFFIAGLYEIGKFISFNDLRNQIVKTMIVVGVVSVLIFYTIPFWGITPKTILVINIILTTFFVYLWRKFFFLNIIKSSKTNVVFFGSSEEIKKFAELVNNRPQLSYNILDVVREDERWDTKKYIKQHHVDIIVIADEIKHNNNLVHMFYEAISMGVNIIDFSKFYESITGQVPVAIINQAWFLDNISPSAHFSYDFLKRTIDIFLALILGIFSLIFYPFVFAAIKLDDGKEIFSFQERVGKNNKIIKLVKFRTMTHNDKGKWSKENENKVTRMGQFLRKSRIDELPQLWNVLAGDVSLIGPRPEFAEPVAYYTKEIPYYNIRHIIKPGLSGWAQLYQKEHPHHGTDVVNTKTKLSYDLFYIKNRSFGLDLSIILKTIRTMLSQVGR